MKEQILKMLSEIRPEFDFNTQNDFLEEGMLDSFDIVTIVDYIEENFGVIIPGDEVLPENFNSLAALESIIKKYQ